MIKLYYACDEEIWGGCKKEEREQFGGIGRINFKEIQANAKVMIMEERKQHNKSLLHTFVTTIWHS
jgi:hypothetical protein